jgi:hypothetical protein
VIGKAATIWQDTDLQQYESAQVAANEHEEGDRQDVISCQRVFLCGRYAVLLRVDIHDRFIERHKHL